MDPNKLDFWSSSNTLNSPMDVMVPPNMEEQFLALAGAYSLRSEVWINDVQTLMDNERPSEDSSKFDWNSYYNLTILYSWLDEVVEKYPKIATSIIGGSSFEGKPIKGVKISYKPLNPGIFIEAGIHAREWIAPATATWILNELLSSIDPEIRFVAENFDWYIFPSVNPDGYQYSHTTNRNWRKTRSRTWHRRCVGVDPNRNWDFHWIDGGASRHPCSETYAGHKAFSEIETKSLSQFINSISRDIQVYFSFHSYGQKFLIPFGHTKIHIPDFDYLETIANNAATVLSLRYGTHYHVGNIVEAYGKAYFVILNHPNLLCVASGGSVDWVRGTLNTPIVYAMELRDTGTNGFILPSSEIIPTGQETLDAIVFILKDNINMIRQEYDRFR
ncbi:Zinc carboxypeptidase [Blattella germanica]|nr:Zinc carboxypeptidase [Blattella germanica]